MKLNSFVFGHFMVVLGVSRLFSISFVLGHFMLVLSVSRVYLVFRHTRLLVYISRKTCLLQAKFVNQVLILFNLMVTQLA